MASGLSSEKIDLLVYGPTKPLVENGFSDQFVLHRAETQDDLERLPADVRGRLRAIAVTGLVPTNGAVLAHYPKLEIISSFGVGYDHIDARYAVEHNIMVTNTPDVLTEEVADTALGLFIATAREFIPADRYLRSGLWLTQPYPLSVGSLRDRKVGMVGMGRIGQAIGRRLDASLVPVPPSWPAMTTWSDLALATPAAIVPTPTSLTSLTLMLARGLTFFKSWINCARSSIE